MINKIFFVFIFLGSIVLQNEQCMEPSKWEGLDIEQVFRAELLFPNLNKKKVFEELIKREFQNEEIFKKEIEIFNLDYQKLDSNIKKIFDGMDIDFALNLYTVLYKRRDCTHNKGSNITDGVKLLQLWAPTALVSTTNSFYKTIASIPQ
jgi:hypothetical protein